MSSFATAQEALRSSVSPEFRNGLQEKILRYIADKMDLSLTIYPITYMERIGLLRAGKIDIMVGLKEHELPRNDFIYLKPSYEQLTNSIFVLRKDQNKFKSLADFKNHTIALTDDNSAVISDLNNQGTKHLSASYLAQKIDLLTRGRVDALIHFTQVTEIKLKELGLDSDIVLANLPPFSVRDHYIRLSLQSPLISKKEKMIQVIKNGVVNGDFKRIRMQHYIETH